MVVGIIYKVLQSSTWRLPLRRPLPVQETGHTTSGTTRPLYTARVDQEFCIGIHESGPDDENRLKNPREDQDHEPLMSLKVPPCAMSASRGTAYTPRLRCSARVDQEFPGKENLKFSIQESGPEDETLHKKPREHDEPLMSLPRAVSQSIAPRLRCTAQVDQEFHGKENLKFSIQESGPEDETLHKKPREHDEPLMSLPRAVSQSIAPRLRCTARVDQEFPGREDFRFPVQESGPEDEILYKKPLEHDEPLMSL